MKKRRWLRILAVVFIALIAVIMVGIGALYAVTGQHINKSWEVDPVAYEVPEGEEAIELGRSLAIFRGCMDCHGEDLSGKVFVDDMPVMRLVAPNLTGGGVGATYTDQDWARSIRHGIGPDGRPLLFMPSYEWIELSNSDLGALVAYLRSVPDVQDVDRGTSSVGPVGRILYLLGELPLLPVELIDHDLQPADPTPGPTAEYGGYLITACTGCHGEGLSGGKIPGVPPSWPEAPNLTAHSSGLADWTKEEFITSLRTGQTPSGEELQNEFMPWTFIGQSSDEDLTAIWLYLRSVPERPHGQR